MKRFWTLLGTVLLLAGCRPVPTSIEQSNGTPIIVEGSRGFLYQIAEAEAEDGKDEVEPGPRMAGSDVFTGKDRALAKTTPSNGPLSEYASVKELLTFLPSTDANMLKLVDKHSPRVAQEEFNVQVTCLLCATKEESDHDFHCILTDDGEDGYITAEVSGIPSGKVEHWAVQALTKARDQFKAAPFFKHVNTSSYIVLKPPMPVTVTGSLFFDVDHPAGAIGPKGMRPKTAWEIHPVTRIQFEP